MAMENTRFQPTEPSFILHNLKDMREGDQGVVYDVPDIRLLASLGIRFGKHIKVLTKSFANGPFIVSVNHRSIVIDRDIAEKITIKI